MATKRQSYQATLRTARARFDLTVAEARILWRQLRTLLGRRPFSTDLRKHPFLTQRALNVARASGEISSTPEGIAAASEGVVEEWELTAKYSEQDKPVKHHVTVRLLGPAGATKGIVRRVFYRWLNGHLLDYWTVFTPIDWEKAGRMGAVTYHYHQRDVATPEVRNLYQYMRVRIDKVDQWPT